jgi:hypothetical protein
MGLKQTVNPPKRLEYMVSSHMNEIYAYFSLKKALLWLGLKDLYSTPAVLFVLFPYEDLLKITRVYAYFIKDTLGVTLGAPTCKCRAKD